MRNLLKNTAALLLLLALVPAARAQTPGAGAKVRGEVDEVEQLLLRNVLAQGGVNLVKLRSRVVRGRVELSTSPAAGSFESYEKAPGMEMSIINTPTGQFISATDGVSHWRQAPWGATTTTVGLSAGENLLKEAAKVKGDFKLRNAFASARLRGRTQLDGREVLVLAATPRGGKPFLMYFDAETYLLRKQEPDRAAGGWDKEPLRAIHIDGYKTVEGVKVPSLFRVVTTQFTLTFRVTEVKHNVSIDDRLFRNPEGN
ncbi:MAG TPA: hypothetical protein VN282_02045 [Pyrinomonadaceae bacterium]|nr:hypothetical protein [Pyrinomonadaceae bacterium]